MTIQRFLLSVILSVVVLATFSAALQGFKASNAKLYQVFDEEMQALAFTLKNSIQLSSAAIVDTQSSFAFQLWHENTLQVKSQNAPAKLITPSEKGFGEQSFLGDRWRYFVLSEDGIKVIVAQPISQRIESIEQVLLEAVMPIAMMIPIIGVLIFIALRKGLAPLKELSRKVKSKDVSDLSPIELEGHAKELEPIRLTINALLKRLGDAFEREQSLASNAAHELRTPISVLKLDAHNLKIALQSGSVEQHHIDALDVNTERMAHVIEQVIALNRTTPENFDAKKTRFDALALLQEIVSNNYQAIDQHGQLISLDGEAVDILADRFSLETLFDNLLKNAIKYSGEGTSIALSLIHDSQHIRVLVEDSGPGIDEDQLDKVMQRFYRVKQHHQTGSGLGLSIVKHVVNLHQGTIQLGRSNIGGLRVEVMLPRAIEADVNG